MSLEYLFAWLMIFLRSLGVIMQLPVVAGRPIPIPVRVGFCAGLAVLLTGVVPAGPFVTKLQPFLAAVLWEVMVGLGLGFVVRFAFGAVEMAGRVISSEVGLNAPPGMGVPEPANEPLASLISTLAIVLFFLLGGHHGVLTALALSFRHAAAGRAAFDPTAGMSMLVGTSHLIEVGLRMAAPFIAMNFLTTLAFAVLARAVPKTNVFILSLSAKVLMGFGLLATSGALIARYLYVEFGDTPMRMLQLMPPR
jgi:flagellar biosynthetic protein FliR